MNDMNAKNLIKLNENDEPEAGMPPGTSMAGAGRPPGGPMRRPPGGPSPHVRRAMGGGEEAPGGQFSTVETNRLKDIMIQMLAKLAGSDLDANIGKALANGQPLEPGQLNHILDEARNLDLTPEQGALLQKIYSQSRA